MTTRNDSLSLLSTTHPEKNWLLINKKKNCTKEENQEGQRKNYEIKIYNFSKKFFNFHLFIFNVQIYFVSSVFFSKIKR